MRGSRFAVAGLMMVGMVALVQAQPGGFGRGGGGVTTIVTNKAVAEEVKLSEEQVTKLKEWSKEFQKKSAEIMKDEGVEFGKGGKGGFGKIDEEMQKKIASATTKINAEAYKQLGDILKKEQIERVKQIERQNLGIRAFTSAEVVEALKLTDAQKSSVKGIGDDLAKETREIYADAGVGGGGKGKFDAEKFQEAQKKVQKVQKEYITKVVDVLEDAQKKTWKELVGEPFDTTKLTPTFGGFGKKEPKKD
jgi:hypothetical protein